MRIPNTRADRIETRPFRADAPMAHATKAEIDTCTHCTLPETACNTIACPFGKLDRLEKRIDNVLYKIVTLPVNRAEAAIRKELAR